MRSKTTNTNLYGQKSVECRIERQQQQHRIQQNMTKTNLESIIFLHWCIDCIVDSIFLDSRSL